MQQRVFNSICNTSWGQVLVPDPGFFVLRKKFRMTLRFRAAEEKCRMPENRLLRLPQPRCAGCIFISSETECTGERICENDGYFGALPVFRYAKECLWENKGRAIINHTQLRNR